MSIISFDQTDKLHIDLLDSFKRDLVSDIYCKDHLYAQYNTYIDEMHIILRNLAIDELECDPAINDFERCYWIAAIFNNSASSFGIIAGVEYTDWNTQKSHMDYIKAEGEILIEDDKLVIWNIDPFTLDFSNKKEFEKARQTHIYKI